MNSKKDHPVSFNTKSLSRWIELLFVMLLLMVLVSGCREASSKTHFSAYSVDSPEQLPADLVNTQIVFRKRQGGSRWLYVTNLSGPTMQDNELEINGNGPVLSPDGDYLVYTLIRDASEGGDDKLSDYQSSIRIRDLSVGSEREIILWPERYVDESISHPNFFPTGNKLIFTLANSHTDQFRLATISLDGSNLEIIDTKPNTLNQGPAISPDGEKILITCEGIDSDSGQPGFMLCIMNLDGSDRILLTNSGDSHGGLFSPSSQLVYFSEFEHGGVFGLINRPHHELKSIGIDGNKLQTILDWHWPVFLMAISEDGGDLVFRDIPQDETPSSLYVVQTNGENLRHLAYFDEFLEEWFSEAE